MTPLEKFWSAAFALVIDSGYAWEIDFVKAIPPPENQTAENFFRQYLWVIVNAGKKEQVVRKHVIEPFWNAMDGDGTLEGFGFEKTSPFDLIPIRKKREAAIYVYNNRASLFREFLDSKDRLAFLDSLPFIAETTARHMARNLGMDCAKPDVHLRRLAAVWGFKHPDDLVVEIQKFTDMRIGVIDVLLWRYCNLTGDYGERFLKCEKEEPQV